MRRVWMLIPAVASIVGAYAWAREKKHNAIELAKNFQASYDPPSGWVAKPHSPQTLFKYADPKTQLILRGAVNQIVSETNPTPDMDTDGIADYYVERTQQAMPQWKAEKLGAFSSTSGQQFDVIRRSTKDRVVVTAYSVKGNTTLLITLFGKGKAKDSVDPNIQSLYGLLKTVSLKEKDMSNL